MKPLEVFVLAGHRRCAKVTASWLLAVQEEGASVRA